MRSLPLGQTLSIVAAALKDKEGSSLELRAYCSITPGATWLSRLVGCALSLSVFSNRHKLPPRLAQVLARCFFWCSNLSFAVVLCVFSCGFRSAFFVLTFVVSGDEK